MKQQNRYLLPVTNRSPAQGMYNKAHSVTSTYTCTVTWKDTCCTPDSDKSNAVSQWKIQVRFHKRPSGLRTWAASQTDSTKSSGKPWTIFFFLIEFKSFKSLRKHWTKELKGGIIWPDFTYLQYRHLSETVIHGCFYNRAFIAYFHLL